MAKFDKDSAFEKILEKIIETREPVRDLLKKNFSSIGAFFRYLEEDKEHSERYARAMNLRCEMMAFEILEISDDNEGDDKAFVGINRVHRAKLQVDSRKWLLSKMLPKKYGDRPEKDDDKDNEIIIKRV